MATNVRTMRRIGQGKVRLGKTKAPCSIYEALWHQVCGQCGYTIHPGDWFSLHTKKHGDLAPVAFCRHCAPISDVKAREIGVV